MLNKRHDQAPTPEHKQAAPEWVQPTDAVSGVEYWSFSYRDVLSNCYNVVIYVFPDYFDQYLLHKYCRI